MKHIKISTDKSIFELIEFAALQNKKEFDVKVQKENAPKVKSYAQKLGYSGIISNSFFSKRSTIKFVKA